MPNDLETRIRTSLGRSLPEWPQLFAAMLQVPGLADLTLLDFAVLVTVADGDVPVNEVATVLHRDVGSVTRACDDLARLGLLATPPGAHLRLSDSGRELLDRMLDVRAAATARILEGMPADAREGMLRFVDAFGAQARKPEPV